MAIAACIQSPEAFRRYARQTVLAEIGETGQKKLAASSILIIGAGGLGNIAAAYLAAMGVGELGIADHDRVELSNLQRQVLYETGDVNRLKVEAAGDSLSELNPEVKFQLYPVRVNAENLPGIMDGHDLVIDGSDNFETRFAVQEACLRQKKTLISAAVIGFSGQIATFKPHLAGDNPCYRCFVSAMPEQDRSCAMEGVLGAAAGVMGSLQAVEAVKELLGIGQSLSGSLLMYDALAGNFRKVILHRDEQCPTCA